ncbi:hypothetical protein BSL78_26568 [Apostichopus japonicus]|uniref:Transmembrane protein n=1 Tax=Stichopus japonicus TaxID=307972 RepID=A0A2G8JLH6_STIJA|nr:hypothetical protein BSL78_26568 [Apostichopus japonicus]
MASGSTMSEPGTEQPLLNPAAATSVAASSPKRDVEQNGTKTSPSHRRRKWWWQHPQVREYKQAIIVAWTLLIIGLGLFVAGILAQVRENETVTDIICIIVGLFFFIPGGYYAVYAYLTTRGRPGYNMDNVSFFSIGKRHNCFG